MNETPKSWPRISSSLYHHDAAKMIDWLCNAFCFELRLKVEGDDGGIVHSELTYGDGVIMVGSEHFGPGARWGVDRKKPKSLAGAVIADPPTVHDYGEDYWADRSYGALDPEGHLWWFTQRLRNPKT